MVTSEGGGVTFLLCGSAAGDMARGSGLPDPSRWDMAEAVSRCNGCWLLRTFRGDGDPTVFPNTSPWCLSEWEVRIVVWWWWVEADDEDGCRRVALRGVFFGEEDVVGRGAEVEECRIGE